MYNASSAPTYIAFGIGFNINDYAPLSMKCLKAEMSPLQAKYVDKFVWDKSWPRIGLFGLKLLPTVAWLSWKRK